MRVGIVLAMALAVGVAGCDLFSPAPEEDFPVEQPGATPEEEVRLLIGDMEAMRGREFSGEVRVEQVAELDPHPSELPESVAGQWTPIGELLFGGEQLPDRVDDPGWADRAVYDADRRRLAFVGDPREDADTALAVAMEVGRALEGEHFSGLSAPQSVDEWLTGRIVERAGPAFMSAVVAVERYGAEFDPQMLAERPELAVYLPGFERRLEGSPGIEEPMVVDDEAGETEFLEQAVRQYVLRGALSVGSALYRSGGWPAVEWGRTEPPAISEFVVRPKRWFDGEGPTTWEWPEGFEHRLEEQGFEHDDSGRIGPAVTSLWLEGLVGTAAARTIYGGWMGDTYRIYRSDDGDQRALYWVTNWATPHDAQQIANASEAALGHYLGHDDRQRRFRVAARGVNVAVAIYEEGRDPDRLDRDVDELTHAQVGFLPHDEAPFEFAPTLYERYVAETERAVLDMDTGEWTDPASGWRAEVGVLDDWGVQRAEEAHVRWFANHPDGTLIQWTTELVDPMATPFGSEAYLEELSERFAASLSAPEDPEVRVTDSAAEKTVELEAMGRVDGRPLVLRMWQWKQGDVLVTFSIQGPEAGFGDRLAEAERILESLDVYGEAIEKRPVADDGDPADDEGIIEFRVGEE